MNRRIGFIASPDNLDFKHRTMKVDRLQAQNGHHRSTLILPIFGIDNGECHIARGIPEINLDTT